MSEGKSKCSGGDMKRWRLEFIKQRHKEFVLGQKKAGLHETIIDDTDDMPGLDGADDLDMFDLPREYEFDAEY